MRSSVLLVSIGFASALFGVLSATAPARADICYDLWVQRNSIYKEYGYCFKTPRAISYFGNAGCQYDNEGDIPLSGRRQEPDPRHQAEREEPWLPLARR